ncbi:ninein isoform X3 [Gymnodraco acuticeps]|uniref:Ninein isoform X3 n=1 Tax=Gymnodraco acuticeps TaxID=8218 RepID=A0A6P8WQQ3_GYMAC|nr:ninein isoform X3 [Gymnodraco acuticeps]
MDEVQEQDEYEERLKEVFHSFDASGCGSLNPEELSDLCCSLQLEEAVLHSLLQRPQQHTDRVDFDQFKNALILVLSSTFEPAPSEQETPSKPDSPEIQPKFVKGSKRYGRRTTPEFIEHHSDFPDVMNADAAQHEDLRDSDDSAVPRKRERWNAHDTSTEEFEAEGQMQLWNPDDPITLRGSGVPLLPPAVQERLQDACHQLLVSWDGSADHSQLMELCQHLGLEINVDVFQSLTGDGEMNVQEFVSRVLNQNKPPTPSASTPYRQLKRLHSTQPFDEGGRRTASCPLSSSIGLRLFSSLDDGSGFTAVESLLDAWMEEGVENSLEILQALNFGLDGRLSLSDLTLALENELLVTKNGIHQAALASFRSEIRHLLERVDRELGEKGRIRSDLEKTEKLKAQLAVEVDERHAAIEQTNNQNLRKLEQDHREKLSVVRSDLMKDMELMQQQSDQKRETLEAELEKIREDESFLRDHLSISLQENRRLEMELLDSTDHLVAAQSQNTKLQTNLENMRKEKFGDLDPGSADFLLQEERIKELHSSYGAHYRELQDRIDELQMELQEFHSVGRVLQPGHKTLSEELESKSPGMESDPGIGADEVQPFSMSLEAEMMLEHLKEQHLQEIEELQSQLECKMNEFDEMLVKKKEAQEEQTASLALQHQQEVEALREEMLGVQKKTQELQIRLEEEISTLQRRLNEEKEEMDVLQEEQLTALRQQLQEAHSYAADLEEQINTNMDEDAVEELRKQQEEEIKKLQEEQVELSDVRLEEERRKQREERRWLKDFENEKELLQERHTEELKVRLEEAKVRFEEEQVQLSEAKREEVTRRLQEEFEKEKEALQERHKEEVKVRLEEVKVTFEEEKVQLEEQSNESLQVVLEEEVLRLVREQQEKEAELRMHWEEETVRLQELHQEALLQERLTLQELHQEAQLQERLTLQELHQEALLQERLTLQGRSEQREARVREELERERLQLEEDYEGMLQERMEEEREKLETQREEEERRVEGLMEEETSRLQEKQQQVMEEERSRLQEKQQEVLEEQRSRLQEKQQEVLEEQRSRLQEKQQQVMKEVILRHAAEREALSGEMEVLRKDIAQERRDIEMSFNRRLQEVQSRFSGDQESVAERFQTDVLKMEQSNQEELKSLSDKQREQELCWEEKIQEVLVNAEEQRRKMEEDEQREKERSEAGRLSEENGVLRQKIAALKDEDLKEVQEELKQTMEHLNKGKTEAQTAAEAFQRRISELRSQSRQLEEQNGNLSEKNSQNLSDVENLQQQLSDLLEESQRREAFTAHEKNKADRVDSLESLEKEAQVQLSAAQEKKVKHNSVRLKSDVRHLQKERDSLKQEVSVLHKQLQNSNEKNQVLEMALHSSGVQSRSRKLFREEMSRLLQQEQTLLKGENQRLQTELRSAKGELRSSRDKVCELDASLLSLEALQQENVCLKQQLETHRVINTGSAAAPSLSDPEALQKENEALRTQVARLSAQMIESFQAQLVGLLPLSPHRIPRGNHRGEEPDNMQQDERQRKVKIMEERMREIELSLSNVKLLLREKVAQLKEQLHKNGKADVLIGNLYDENDVLLEVLEKTKQRHIILEKKNFLLEEKISSLNKIMCNLTPPPSLPYHY